MDRHIGDTKLGAVAEAISKRVVNVHGQALVCAWQMPIYGGALQQLRRTVTGFGIGICNGLQ